MKYHIENQVLTVEQMQELQNLGINIYRIKSSMIWRPKLKYSENGEGRPEIVGYFLEPNDIPTEGIVPFWNTWEGKRTYPTFTLQDIINYLPQFIEENEIGRFDYELRVKKDEITYESYDALDKDSEPFVLNVFSVFDEGCNTLIDCAFEMLKWYITRNNK